MSRSVRRACAPVIAAFAAALLLTACGGQDTAASQAPPARSAEPSGTQEGGTQKGGTEEGGKEEGGRTPAAGSDQAATDLARSTPQRVTIPSLGVSSELETLGQNGKGAMTTPKNPDLAGWYKPGPTPGSRGPAVIAGHVTWNGADAVFKELKTMKAGDTVEVTREDGKTATFTVDRVEEYPKKEFPTLKVYGDIDHAGLRLITCGGDFDADRHYYRNNVTVFASMTGVS
ncbi:class F sortase [Streptomyces sp. NPDC056486]|uniref:class F sortase n=1 Tax=Streptomyces sp. NPDC056486 TaxID=3345835 RepID=UPI0036A4ABE2